MKCLRLLAISAALSTVLATAGSASAAALFDPAEAPVVHAAHWVEYRDDGWDQPGPSWRHHWEHRRWMHQRWREEQWRREQARHPSWNDRQGWQDEDRGDEDD